MESYKESEFLDTNFMIQLALKVRNKFTADNILKLILLIREHRPIYITVNE